MTYTYDFILGQKEKLELLLMLQYNLQLLFLLKKYFSQFYITAKQINVVCIAFLFLNFCAPKGLGTW